MLLDSHHSANSINFFPYFGKFKEPLCSKIDSFTDFDPERFISIMVENVDLNWAYTIRSSSVYHAIIAGRVCRGRCGVHFIQAPHGALCENYLT